MFSYDHIALNVLDLSESREFYESLGGKVVSKPSDKFVEMLFGGHRLHLVKAPSNGLRQGVGLDHFAVSVTDSKTLDHVCNILNECHSIARFRPFKVIPSPELGTSEHVEERPPRHTIYAKDPNGITFEIRSYN